MGQISATQRVQQFNWIQIGTDCVFSGESGSYLESSVKEATDLYSESKIAGEEFAANSMFIRSSIIGPDRSTSAGLYSWFKGAIGLGPISGFVNHHWNGVSTTAFARLAAGIVLSGITQPFHQHWVPQDKVSKFELLGLFSNELGLPAEMVKPFEAEVAINRTLATIDPDFNRNLWILAGYNQEQSVARLCHEFIAVDKELG